jgi:hypothetical protein
MAEWFAPKRYGLGGGVPIAWQGWIVLGVYLAIIIAASQLLNQRPWAMVSVIVPATMIFLVIVVRTTRGGWRWRWGSED